MNVYFTRALAKQVGPSESVIIDNVNPGAAASELMRKRTILIKIARWLMFKLFSRTTEEGARILVWAALAGTYGPGPAPDQLRGAYVNNSRIEEESDFVISDKGAEVQSKLWVRNHRHPYSSIS